MKDTEKFAWQCGPWSDRQVSGGLAGPVICLPLRAVGKDNKNKDR
jgi:hypothetical protein